MSNPESDHAEVLEFLAELGATVAQLAEAAASESPARIALDVVLARSFVLSAREVARRAGLPLEDVLGIVEHLG